MMKPILFSTENVRSLLAGRKSVTRRVVKGVKSYWGFDGLEIDPDMVRVSKNGSEHPIPLKGLYAAFEQDGLPEFPLVKSPYCPGDILYVRETWIKNENPESKSYGEYEYKADYSGSLCQELIKWRPSIRMPKEAARLFLRVTDVRVERLQDITVDGALSEGTSGVEPPPICQKEISYPESFPKGFDKWDEARREDWIQSTARARYIGWCDFADSILKKFRTIWDSTIKKADLSRYGWATNPWVWVIEFERISKEEALKGSDPA